MADNTEAQMLQNLDVYIGVTAAMGAGYMPPSPWAAITHLQNRADEGQAAVDALDAREAEEEAVRNARQAVYVPAAALGSDVYQLCKAMGWAENDLAALQSKVREMRGARSQPKPKDDPNTPDVDESETGGSASQRGYASVERHWSEFVALLVEKGYSTSESGMKLNQLIALRDAMRDANLAVANAEGATAAALQTRDKVFYTGEGNLVESATLGKAYLRAVHSDTQAWATVKDFEFRVPKRLR